VFYENEKLFFNNSIYWSKIRPILFENLHIMDKEIQELILSIDLKLRSWLQIGPSEQESTIVARIYLEVIKLITNQYNMDNI
jgi:hypothetical protein